MQIYLAEETPILFLFEGRVVWGAWVGLEVSWDVGFVPVVVVVTFGPTFWCGASGPPVGVVQPLDLSPL